MADNRRETEVTDPAAWRQLAHPTRRRIIVALQHREAARASDLAEEIGAATNAVSFHIRRLAEYGFVEEAPSPSGDGREKWWRSTALRGFRVDQVAMAKSPEGARAVNEVKDAIEAEAHEFIATWFTLPAPAGEHVDDRAEMRMNFELQLDLSGAEYRDFTAQLRALLYEWSERTRTQEFDDTRRRFHIVGFGMPTRTAESER